MHTCVWKVVKIMVPENPLCELLSSSPHEPGLLNRRVSGLGFKIAASKVLGLGEGLHFVTGCVNRAYASRMRILGPSEGLAISGYPSSWYNPFHVKHKPVELTSLNFSP